MSVLLILRPKCTLGASHAAPLVSHGEYADGTDRRSDRSQTITLRFPLDVACVTTMPVLLILGHTCTLAASRHSRAAPW